LTNIVECRKVFVGTGGGRLSIVTDWFDKSFCNRRSFRQGNSDSKTELWLVKYLFCIKSSV
jgi:hypothetical protein